MGQRGLWDEETRHEKLAEKKSLLPRLAEMVPWESFRETLDKVHQKERKSNAGRKPIDAVLMFKLLVLQKLYNISDEELEYQVNDRLSFMRFLGLGLEDVVPDGTTVWLFREELTKRGLIEQLFQELEEYLQQEGYKARGGQIIDATLIPVPKQHNSKEENEQIKAGESPKEWERQPNKQRQKDTDARWTKKNNISYYGYKDHICRDVRHGFIRRYAVTDASVHDSQMLGEVLDGNNSSSKVWADSAYRSEPIETVLELMGFTSHIHERGYRNHPLTGRQKQKNRTRSRTRAKVEHVFGCMVNEMGGKLLRSIGLERAKANLGLKNLTYNLKRLVMWESKKLAA